MAEDGGSNEAYYTDGYDEQEMNLAVVFVSVGDQDSRFDQLC